MDEIAERAGVSKPVLYQHFPGKLELYLALLDESVDTLVETVRDALRSNPDNKQRVAATFGAYFEYVGGQGMAYRLVFESDLGNEPAVRARLDRGQQECAAMVSQVVREDAGISDDEAYLLSVGMVGMAHLARSRPAGSGRAAGGQARLARHQRLAAQRALSTGSEH
jgi:AcrR family transcriptional regulator